MNLLLFLTMGSLAGWLAGQFMKGGGLDLLVNIILGVVGGMVGGWLFDVIGISSGGSLIGSLITSFIGAAGILFVANLFKK
jgi:uncharacterized membrane protein YeaQ/YmgE (transglycosylase-associated protein family)